MDKVFRIVLICIVAYGVLYWASNNPKSVTKLKNAIDTTASQTVEKAKGVANNLTDEE